MIHEEAPGLDVRPAIEFALERAIDRRERLGSQKRVDLGKFRDQVLRVTLGQAPGDHDLVERALVLEFDHLQDGLDRLLLRALDEPAGVHDDDVGRVGIRGHLERVIALNQADHHLGVDPVLGASERDHVYFLVHVNCVREGLRLAQAREVKNARGVSRVGGHSKLALLSAACEQRLVAM